MTATTVAAQRRDIGDPVRFSSLFRSEWVKLASLRSTKITLVALIAVGIAFGVFSGLRVSAAWATADWRDHFDPTELSFVGLYIAQLAIGVLGALAICGEFATGTIRTTLLVTPRRGSVVAAKVLVFATFTFAAGQIVAFASFGVTQALFSGPVPHATLADPAVLRAVILSGAYLPLIGLMALGLGLIIRSTAGSIAAFVGVVLVLPGLIGALGDGIADTVMPYTPGGILTTFMTPAFPPPHSLDPWIALVVLVGEVAVIFAVGMVLFARRDM